MTGGKQKIYISVTRKDTPTIVNLGNTAEEGFEQCYYVLPR